MFLAAAAAGLVACAATTETAGGPPAGRDCFNQDAVTGYSVIDDHTIGVSVGANRRYIFTTDWNASDLDWTQAIAIRSDSSWICTGNGLGVEIIGGEPRRTYPVDNIARAPDPNPVEGS
jgi:hypothetical protein